MSFNFSGSKTRGAGQFAVTRVGPMGQRLTEKSRTQVAVRERRAGLVLQLDLREPRRELLRVVLAVGVRGDGRVLQHEPLLVGRVPRQPGGVGGEFQQRDLPLPAMGNDESLRQVEPNGVVQLDLPLLDHEGEQQGRDGLAHRADLEERVGSGLRPVRLRPAVAEELTLAVGGDDSDHQTDRPLLLHHGLDEIIDATLPGGRRLVPGPKKRSGEKSRQDGCEYERGERKPVPDNAQVGHQFPQYRPGDRELRHGCDHGIVYVHPASAVLLSRAREDGPSLQPFPARRARSSRPTAECNRCDFFPRLSW